LARPPVPSTFTPTLATISNSMICNGVDSDRFNPPKYATPYDQIERAEEIQAGEDTYCDSGY